MKAITMIVENTQDEQPQAERDQQSGFTACHKRSETSKAVLRLATSGARPAKQFYYYKNEE